MSQLKKITEYEVMVGNVGCVYRGLDGVTAREFYDDYVALSKASLGRAAGSAVIMFEDGHSELEYEGTGTEDGADIYERHAAMVRKLIKPPAAVRAALTDEDVAVLHAAIGIAGEAAELLNVVNEDHLLEECGDILFYLRDMRNILGCPDGLSANVGDELGTSLAIEAGNILDAVKKLTIYRKPDPDRKLRGAIAMSLDYCEQCVELMLNAEGLTTEDALEHNLNKLLTGNNARYHTGGYSDAQAADRADKKGEEV